MKHAPTVRLLAAALIAFLSTALLSVAPEPGRASPTSWRTWLLEAPDQFRLAPPPDQDSRRTRRELRELRSLQEDRTAAVRRRVRFWNVPPATQRWTEVILDMIVKHRPRPAFAARALALLHTGMYDALVAAHDTRDAFNRIAPPKADSRIDPLLAAKGSSYPPPLAVISGAAEEILSYLFPNEPDRTFEELATEAVESRLWAGVNYQSDVERGRALGGQVADLFIARGQSDGSSNTGFSNPRPEGEEFWEPTPVGFEGPIGGPVGTWTPWLMETPTQGRTGSGIPPPFAYGSPEFMEELEEVIDVQANLTDEHKAIAVFWDDGPNTFTPPGHWNDIALDQVRSRDLGTNETAELFAVLNAAEADAAIAFFETKYQYWSIRPVTAAWRICDADRHLCTDEELDPEEDRTENGDRSPYYGEWLSYINTPAFPSYPSGHATFSGAAGAVLGNYFPAAADELNAMADQAAMSRLLGGIHYRSDDDQGLVLGRYIAGLAITWPEGAPP